MGRARGKLAMKYITKEKLRMSTYNKRKKGLMKKVNEFSILCDVDTCMIMYGPKMKDSPAKLEIWPSDPAQVTNVINKYKEKPEDVRRKKWFNVFDSFAARHKKVCDEIDKVRRANVEAKFPTWDDRLNDLSSNQLLTLLARLDSNIEAAEKKIKVMNHQSLVEIEMDDSKLKLFNLRGLKPFEMNYVPSYYPFNQGQGEALQVQPLNLNGIDNSRLFNLSGLKPFEMNYVPSYNYPFNQGQGEALQLQPLNLNGVDNSMMMLSTNGSDALNQVDGESSSNITYGSLSPNACYDPTSAAASMLGNYDAITAPSASMLGNVNVPLNNPWGPGPGPGPGPLPFCLYTPFVQPTTPFGQHSATSSFPSHQLGGIDGQPGPNNIIQRF